MTENGFTQKADDLSQDSEFREWCFGVELSQPHMPKYGIALVMAWNYRHGNKYLLSEDSNRESSTNIMYRLYKEEIMSRLPKHQIEAITIPIPPRKTPYSPMSPVSPVPWNQPPLYIPPIIPSIPGGNPR